MFNKVQVHPGRDLLTSTVADQCQIHVTRQRTGGTKTFLWRLRLVSVDVFHSTDVIKPDLQQWVIFSNCGREMLGTKRARISGHLQLSNHLTNLSLKWVNFDNPAHSLNLLWSSQDPVPGQDLGGETFMGPPKSMKKKETCPRRPWL